MRWLQGTEMYFYILFYFYFINKLLKMPTLILKNNTETKQVMCLWKKLVLLFCRRNTTIKLLMAYHYTHRSVPCSTLMREVSEVVFLLQMGINTEIHKYTILRHFGALSPEWDVFIKSLPIQSSKIYVRRRQKDFKSQRQWIIPCKQCFLDTTGLIYK